MPEPKPLSVSPQNAPKFWDWLHNRGGLYVWENHDLSSRGESVTTPAMTIDRKPMGSPEWRYPGPPSRHIIDAHEVVVTTSTVLEEISVAVRMGSQGLKIKLTDGAARKMNRAVAKWQKKFPDREIWWTPTGDLFEPSCVVLMDSDPIPLPTFMESK